MKHLFKNILVIMGVLSLLVFNACDDDISPIYDNLEYDRVFSPIDFQAEILNQTTVELTWKMTKGIDQYVLEISYDNLEFANIIHTVTVTEADLPYSYDLPAGDAQYSARVKAVSTSSAADSKWSTVAFASLPENLFEGYSTTMDALNAITLNWEPGKAVTNITFVDGNGVTQEDYTVTAEELAAGTKSMTDVQNGVYNINLMNGADIRGTQPFVMEGTDLLADGGDLAAAIAAADAGGVIVLSSGRYSFSGDLLLDKSIKIKGLVGHEMPILYVTDGNRMFQVGENLTPSDSLVFDNLYMNGLTNFSVDGSPIRGIFDIEEGELCNLGIIKFKSCKLYDFERQIVRMRGGAAQTIGLYAIDDCIIHNIANKGYAVLCATETDTNVGVFEMTHSTIDSVATHVIRYDDATACERITIDACTFYRSPFASGRYVADMKNAVVSDGVYVSNCIFGSTSYEEGASINGIRVKSGVKLDVSDSYSTTDFVLSGYTTMNDELTSTGVSSDMLWTDPDNGDFSFKGDVVKAGDPRWY